MSQSIKEGHIKIKCLIFLTEQMESDNQKMEDDKNNTVIVHFRALERPKEDEFCLEL